MLDTKQLKKRVFLRLLGSPLTVVPIMAGATVLTAGWALNWNPGLTYFGALAGFLAAGGSFLTRLLLSGDRMARRVSAEAARQEQVQKQRSLDELDKRLTTGDNDPRPETALRDLRALLKAFDETDSGASNLTGGSLYDIQAMVSRLFNQCVHSLRQTEQLWQTAQRLRLPAARQPILDQREKLIADVQSSIKQLSDTLVALQTLGSGEGSNAQLQHIRADLDQSLAVAKRVEERLSSFIKETELTSYEQTPHRKQQNKE
jgi:hypothetical protein